MDDQLILKNRLKAARAEKNLSQGALEQVGHSLAGKRPTGAFSDSAR